MARLEPLSPPVPAPPAPQSNQATPSVRAALPERWVVALLVLGLAGVYFFFYRGNFKNPADEWFMFVLGDSLARNLSLDVNQMGYVGEFKGLAQFGADGNLYSKYSVVQSLLGAPVFWLARWIPWAGQAPLALLINPLLTAGTAALLYLTGRRLGYTRAVCLATALSFGLATGAFVYTKTFASEVTAAICLAGALLATLLFKQGGGYQYAVITGAALGILIANKQANLVVLPGFLLAFWLVRRWDGRLWLALAAPLVTAGLLIVAYNFVRFGDPLQTGYTPADGGFTADLAVTLPALLISPGRGIVLFSPVLLLALSGLPWLGHRHPWLTWLLLSTAIPFAVLFAAWHGWHGGMTVWGPRHWLPLLPFACLPLLVAYQWLFESAGQWTRVAAAAIVALSVVIQLSAVSFNYLVRVDEVAAERQMHLLNEDEALARFTFDVGASPLLHQWRLARPRFADVVWLQAESDGRTAVDRMGLLAALAAPLAAGLAIAGILAGRPRRPLLAAGATIVLAAGLLLTVRESERLTRAGGDWPAAVAFAQASAPANSALVTLGTEALGATFTRLKSDLDHVGLAPPLDAPVDDTTRRWFALAADDRSELWSIWPSATDATFAPGLGAVAAPTDEWQSGTLTVRRWVPLNSRP